jgi:hypothetical protein
MVILIFDILDQFKLPLFQRTKNELHVNEIYDSMKRYCVHEFYHLLQNGFTRWTTLAGEFKSHPG